MGKRLLRENIIRPLQSKKDIENRLSLVEEFLANPILLDKIDKRLKMVSDLDNILTRLAMNRALPRDLVHLKRSLQSVLDIFEIIRENGNKKIMGLLNL